jgi:pyruvate dehydrogenase E1 component alpha subunit
VVFIIENNRYSMGTNIERSSASRDLSQNGVPWGMPSLVVDGMSVMAVKAAGAQAVAHCRAGKGPFLLEMKTYRYRGHSMSDPGKYRTREEIQRMRAEHDCLDSAKKLLEELGVSEAELKQLDDSIKARVQEAADFAQSAPEPEPPELFTDILVEV